VNRLTIIRALLSFFVISGLILAPVAKPAFAMSMPASASVAVGHDGGMAMHSASMGEMPCCPDEAPKSDCAKDCPLMAICMAKTFQNVSYAASPLVFFTLARVIFPVSHARLDSLEHSPTPRPPNA
jgi:hypothetical protein